MANEIHCRAKSDPTMTIARIADTKTPPPPEEVWLRCCLPLAVVGPRPPPPPPPPPVDLSCIYSKIKFNSLYKLFSGNFAQSLIFQNMSHISS